MVEIQLCKLRGTSDAFVYCVVFVNYLVVVYLGFLVRRKACFVRSTHFPPTSGAHTRCGEIEVCCTSSGIDPSPSTVQVVQMAVLLREGAGGVETGLSNDLECRRG